MVEKSSAMFYAMKIPFFLHKNSIGRVLGLYSEGIEIYLHLSNSVILTLFAKNIS